MNRAINPLSVFLSLVVCVGCATNRADDIARIEKKGDTLSLGKLAQDTSATVHTRQRAINALARIGNEDALQALRALVRDNTSTGGTFWQVTIPVGKTVRDPRYAQGVYLTGTEKKTMDIAGTPFEINNVTYVYSAYEARQFEEQGAIVKQMDNTRYPVRESARAALRAITGEDFDTDQAKSSERQGQNEPTSPPGRETVREDQQTTAGLQKHTDTFGRVAWIYDRLLTQPRQPRAKSWVLWRQIRDEMTPEEKAIVMVSFEGGQFTAVDWFAALHYVAPPNRPRNLDTARGVEDFLDRFLLSERYFQARVAAQPWVSARMIDTIEAYQDYIEKYPQSKYTPIARKRIEYLNTTRSGTAEARQGDRTTE